MLGPIDEFYIYKASWTGQLIQTVRRTLSIQNLGLINRNKRTHHSMSVDRVQIWNIELPEQIVDWQIGSSLNSPRKP